MGIEKFGRIFDKKFFIPAQDVEKPKEIKSLMIDCNGIFHKAKGKVFPVLEKNGQKIEDLSTVKKKYTLKGLKETYISTIIEKLEELLTTFSPTKNFILAPDGTANAAKINQQKTRRFSPKEEIFFNFDGNSLTPGTQIMIEIDKAIRNWLEKKSKKGELPPNTIYSSHLDPGEGEHKIFHYIRQGFLVDTDDNIFEGFDDSEPNFGHVVYGADGDLFMLSMLSPMENIYLFRDNDEKLYSIEKFKDGVWKSISFDGCNEKRLYQDFALMVIFVGNDFVPKFPNLPGTVATLFDVLLRIYRSMKTHLTNSDNEILWDRFNIFLKKLSGWKVGKTEDTYLYARDKLRYPVKEIDKHTMIKDVDGRVVDWKEGDYDQSRHTRVFDRRSFEKDWYGKQFKPLDGRLYPTKEYYTKKDIFNMCVSFLKTLQWNQFYYTKGYRYVSYSHFYPYRVTPLVHNMSYYLNSILEKRNQKILTQGILFSHNDVKITPIHQLLSVLPPSSIKIIPKEYRDLYSMLSSVNPETYMILSPENTDESHAITPLIPPINLDLVDMLIRESDIPMSKKYQDQHFIIYS